MGLLPDSKGDWVGLLPDSSEGEGYLYHVVPAPVYDLY